MKRKAFTLVEILVVIVIIGIILAFLIPNALRATRVAQGKQCASNIQAINSAIQMCMAETRTASSCNNLAALDTGNYAPQGTTLANLKCPITNSTYILTDTTTIPRVDSSAHFDASDFGGTHLNASGS